MVVRSAVLALSVFSAAACIHGCKSQDAAPAPTSPPDLQLVAAGSEPRRILRYRPPIGTKQRLEVKLDSEVEAGTMGGPMPTIVMTITVSVDALLPSGHMRVRATFDGATAIDHPKSAVPAIAVAGSLEKMRGLAIDALLSPNGRLVGARVDTRSRPATAELDTQVALLVGTFEQTMMPFPDEAVGVGAVWRNSRPLDQNGMKLKTVNSVTINAMTGDSISYTLETDIHGDDQSVTQSGLTIEVKDIVGTGGGKGTLDLATLALTSELLAEFRTEMTTAGDTEPTKMTMATLSKVRPLPARSDQGAQSAP